MVALSVRRRLVAQVVEYCPFSAHNCLTRTVASVERGAMNDEITRETGG